MAEKFLDRGNVLPVLFDRIPFDRTLHPDLLEAIAPPLFDTQVFEHLQVPRQPPEIRVEGGDMPAPEVLGIIVRHCEHPEWA